MRSKAYYLQQVHQPRHLKESARMFGPDILEVRNLALKNECLMQMCYRCVRERSGMSCLYSGHLSRSTCSFVLSSNSPDLSLLSSKILPYPYLTSSPFPRTLLWKQCYVSSLETLCGRFWSTLCIASCSMSTAGFQINHYFSCFISQRMEFTITFPWIGMFRLESIFGCKPIWLCYLNFQDWGWSCLRHCSSSSNSRLPN